MLENVAKNLRPRADDEAPDEPGLCIDGAFITDNPAVTHERVTIGVRLMEFPDVHFSIEVNKNQGRIVESNALAPRLKQARDQARSEGLGLWYARITTLRQGDRALGNWKGFENLAYLPGREDMGAKHDFAFMALGSPADPYLPMMDVEMSTGVSDNASGKVTPSITDEEAVTLWDKLTSSIRVRPTNGAAKIGDAAPSRPLGELAATGRDCPATGWWRCADEGDVKGGRHQFFRAGERMPHVVLQGDPSLWQKLKGDTPTHRIATVWKLVEHDAPITSTGAPPAVAAVPMPQQLPPFDKS